MHFSLPRLQMGIENHFDIPFIANLALREKQIQQNYRPIIAVHKWFARRPGTLFRGLLPAEFQGKPLHEAFYESNSLSGRTVADPFMGGGTPLIEANRTGCDVVGFDINPMAYWIVKQEIEHLDLGAYMYGAQALREKLAGEIDHNDLGAYCPLAVAILDAGLTCSASLPCPAEMGASIHINGTGSSIIDTVFVCRSTGSVPRKWIVDSMDQVADLVREDMTQLRRGNVKPTPGDVRCVAYGHLIRLAVWNLRETWDKTAGIDRRLAAVTLWLRGFGAWKGIELGRIQTNDPTQTAPLFAMHEPTFGFGDADVEIPF